MFRLVLFFILIISTESFHKIEKICSGQSKILNCEDGSIIKIFRSNIENKMDGTCREKNLMENALVLCERSKAEEVVRALCENKVTCQINFAKCPNYLKVQYYCKSEKVETTTTTTTLIPTTVIGCSSKKSRGIIWPQTVTNVITKQNCPQNSEGGEAWWRCGEDDEWIGEPNLFACYRRDFIKFADELSEKLSESQINEMLKAIIELKVSTGGEIKKISEILKKILESKLTKHSLRNLFDVVEMTLDDQNGNNWMEIQANKMDYWNFVQTIASAYAVDLHYKQTNIELEMNTGNNCVGGKLDEKKFDLFVSVENGHVQFSSKSCHRSLTIIDLGRTPSLVGIQNLKHLSNMFVVATNQKQQQNWMSSDDNLTVVLKLNYATQNKVNCFQWSPYENSYETQDACRLLWSNSSHVTCQCPTPSTFVVMETSTTPSADPSTNASLPIAAYVGCTLGILGMIITVILYAFLACKTKKEMTYAVYLNYSISHSCSAAMCLIGLVRLINETLCTIVALSLHYCSMVGLMWLLCGSFHIYFCLIKNKKQNSVSQEAWFYVVSSTLPLIVVIVSAAVSFDSYKQTNNCWMNSTTGIEWAFIGPAILMLWFSVALNCVSWKTLKNLSNETECVERENQVCHLKSGLKRLILLTVLSYLVWSSWLLYVYLVHLFFAYLFSVLTTLMGLLLIFNAATDIKVGFQESQKKQHEVEL